MGFASSLVSVQARSVRCACLLTLLVLGGLAVPRGWAEELPPPELTEERAVAPLPMPQASEGPDETLPPPTGVVPEQIPAPQQVPPQEVALPLATLALDSGVPPDVAASCARKKGLIWEDDITLQCLPQGLLWRVPWANQREPRMFGKFNNALDRQTIDTAVGGQFGLARLAPCDHPFEGIQLDIMAAVFTRFDGSILRAADYRAGVPVTFAMGPWQAKLSYEHTSSHVGDEFLDANPGTVLPHFTRDEFVIGLAYFFTDYLRAYGQLGLSVGKRRPPGGRARYDLGLEWSRPISESFKGRPYATIDLDLRPEQDYEVNTTLQVGWLWEHPETRHAVRLGLEYYKGKSPYGAFFARDEDWVGAALQYDW